MAEILKDLEDLMSYLNNFLEKIENHDYPGLLGLWEEYCLGDTLDLEETRHILEALKKSDMTENFGRHVENILHLFKPIEDSPARYAILKLIFDLQTSNSEELWELAQAEIEKKYSFQENYQEKLRILGIRNKGNFQGVISNFELLNHMIKGNFVFHTGGWGVGEVMDCSLLREQLSVEFDYVPGIKDLSFKNAFKTLLPLPDDHFLALRFGSPDQLEERARTNPRDVIKKLLRDLGPKTAQDIKDELCELVIPAPEWTKWWQMARSKLKRDTFIEMPSSLKEPFRLRQTEVSHEERLAVALEKKPDANTLIQMVYSFLKDFSETLKNEQFRSTLESKLSEILSYEEITDAQELQIHYFLQDLSGKREFSSIQELIKRIQNIEEVLAGISILSFKKRTLIEIRKGREDWKDLFLKLFLTIDYNPLRDFILSELNQAQETEALTKKLEELCASPSKYPDICLWYFQKITSKETSLPLSNSEGKSRFFEAFLILLSHAEQTNGQRDLIKKMHKILTKNRYSVVRMIMKEATINDVKEFLLLSTKCHSLSDHDIKILHSLAEVAHPKLAKKGQQSEAEDVIWTTQEGYNSLQEKIKQIGTVETVHNAKEIEIARGHGDLRENAEFKAALERRDRLQTELKLLSDQINHSRIITKDDITTNAVSIGTIVECENANGEKVTFTILGPQDTDPEKHILSFQSKLAQSMIGRKLGDPLTAQGQELKITNIRSYLTKGNTE